MRSTIPAVFLAAVATLLLSTSATAGMTSMRAPLFGAADEARAAADALDARLLAPISYADGVSQYEQQVRALCGLPLGDPRREAPAAAMANLLGDVWADGEPDWAAALAVPGLRLHLYGKSDPRPGRKMGHLTVTAATLEEAERRAVAARAALAGQPAEARTGA